MTTIRDEPVARKRKCKRCLFLIRHPPQCYSLHSLVKDLSVVEERPNILTPRIFEISNLYLLKTILTIDNPTDNRVTINTTIYHYPEFDYNVLLCNARERVQIQKRKKISRYHRGNQKEDSQCKGLKKRGKGTHNDKTNIESTKQKGKRLLIHQLRPHVTLHTIPV